MVSKVLDNDRYVQEDVPGAKRTQRTFQSVFASDRIKPWCEQLDKSEDDDSCESDYLNAEDGVDGTVAELSG